MPYDYIADGVSDTLSQLNNQIRLLEDNWNTLAQASDPIFQGAWLGKGSSAFQNDFTVLSGKVETFKNLLTQFENTLQQAAGVAEQAVSDTGKIADSISA